ncbi:MAG: thiolase family protein, partial [Chitinophagia bacterium]|nr:thiolase family protein [Chitinophagia bacterium]
ETAENVADKWGITREEQDEFAMQSQMKYASAQAEGRFQLQIIPVTIHGSKGQTTEFVADEHPRLSSLDKLAALKPAFKKSGSVTAGNSSGINDGAAVLLIVSEKVINLYGLKPIAKVIGSAVAGVDPAYMGIGPVPATKKLLHKLNLQVEDIDLFELNEAFAAQSIACMRDLQIDPEKVNVNGGSIAIGHPLGASGARISTTLIHEMQRRQAKRGIATMCIGVGQGLAVAYELC